MERANPSADEGAGPKTHDAGIERRVLSLVTGPGAGRHCGEASFCAGPGHGVSGRSGSELLAISITIFIGRKIPSGERLVGSRYPGIP